ncbi:MAG: hypothetical protein CM15mP81_10640 [Alphaproteobacteria bacterium]|nr:MAG: hypothetical protein CM15mP81_10640 [Alphaproteobacteria bacterium]
MPSKKIKISTKHDPFPGLPKEGLQINISLNIDNIKGTLTIDLRDNPDNLPCGLNLNRGYSNIWGYDGNF